MASRQGAKNERSQQEHHDCFHKLIHLSKSSPVTKPLCVGLFAKWCHPYFQSHGWHWYSFFLTFKPPKKGVCNVAASVPIFLIEIWDRLKNHEQAHQVAFVVSVNRSGAEQKIHDLIRDKRHNNIVAIRFLDPESFDQR